MCFLLFPPASGGQRFRLACNKFGWTDHHERASFTWRAASLSTFHLNQILKEYSDPKAKTGDNHAEDSKKTRKYSIDGHGDFQISKEEAKKELVKWHGKQRFETDGAGSELERFDACWNYALEDIAPADGSDPVSASASWEQFLYVWRNFHVDHDLHDLVTTHRARTPGVYEMDDASKEETLSLLQQYVDHNDHVNIAINDLKTTFDKQWDGMRKNVDEWIDHGHDELTKAHSHEKQEVRDHLEDNKEAVKKKLKQKVGNIVDRVKCSLAVEAFFRS